MKKLGLFMMMVAFVMASCTSQETVRYTVASKKVDCIGVGPQECMQVKKGDETDWSFFYGNIEGFTYEAGYEYVLDIKEEKLENVPADASAIKYILVKEVSKTEKTSENMLEGIAKATKYQWTAKVVAVEGGDVGVGAAKGKFPVTVVKLEVTALNSADLPFKEGVVIHSELIAKPSVKPEVGNEYVFKAKDLHPAHALGVYTLETDVIDLTH